MSEIMVEINFNGIWMLVDLDSVETVLEQSDVTKTQEV